MSVEPELFEDYPESASVIDDANEEPPDDVGREILAAIASANIRLERIAQVLERAFPGSPNMTVPPPPAAVPAPIPAPGAIPWSLPAQAAQFPQAPAPGLIVLTPPTCPDHGWAWKHVPAGVTKSGPRAGQPYNAFYACPERGCRQRPTIT